jgi:ferredoxin--NADP+ reductase
MKLTRLKLGEAVYTLVGPLGKPTEIERFGTVLLGGGCYGLGGIYPLARAFKEKGNKVIALLEARTSYLIYNEDKIRDVADEVIIATADGSRGVRGHVWEAIKILEERGEKIDHAHFVGCTYMMMTSSRATEPAGIPTIVSLNSLMVDGTGMCGCCRVLVGGETKFQSKTTDARIAARRRSDGRQDSNSKREDGNPQSEDARAEPCCTCSQFRRSSIRIDT